MPKTETYSTISGETLEYPKPSAAVAAFLARVRDAAHDPTTSEPALAELIYGSENPMLDQTIFRGRGAVTRAVFEDPVYHVMLDLLDLKRVQAGTLQPELAASRYTMSVTEAATAIGVSSSAVRQAIAAGHLAAWKKSGRYLLDPESVGTYRDRVTRRGPKREPALRVRMGSKTGASFRVKVQGGELVVTSKSKHVSEGEVARFERVAVAFSGKKMHRLFILEPSESEDSFEFEGFEVRGRYRIAEKINDAQRSSEAFRAFPG